MPSICFYFQVHQPKRLRNYTFFDIGNDHNYEDEIKNRDILLKVATKCYLPTNRLLLDLIKKFDGRFKFSFSLSGTLIEQLKRHSQETLDSFKALTDTGCVEILNETYHHSLAFLYSKSAFLYEVSKHKRLIQDEFGQTATTFRHTELIFNNDLASTVASLGYKTILAEGADKILQWRSPNYMYESASTPKINLLLRNYPLSDNIAFRFSNAQWSEYPLTADKFAHWLHGCSGHGEIINLFMDYETFGEHQWVDTGIFKFLEVLPGKILESSDYDFSTPSEASHRLSPIATLDIPHFYSWADTERDLTAWIGNHLQTDALETIYALEDKINLLGNIKLKNQWHDLLTSDHFYYMCTKWNADGDVHQYFSPYNDPYEAYIIFQNIVKDFSTVIDAEYQCVENV